MLDKVVQGENLKESLKKEAITGVDNLLEKGGLGRQYGTGSIKTLKIHNQTIIPTKKVKFHKNHRLVPKSKNIVRKRNRSDAFGLY